MFYQYLVSSYQLLFETIMRLKPSNSIFFLFICRKISCFEINKKFCAENTLYSVIQKIMQCHPMSRNTNEAKQLSVARIQQMLIDFFKMLLNSSIQNSLQLSQFFVFSFHDNLQRFFLRCKIFVSFACK